MTCRSFSVRCVLTPVSVLALAALGSSCACSSASSGGGGGGGSGGSVNLGGSGGGGGSGGISVGGSGGIDIDGGGGAGGTNACNQAVDIVFVMDVSTSMGSFLSKLADEIEVVDGAVKALNLSSTPHYGLVVFVDDTMFVNSGKPYADVLTLKTDFQSWASFTSSNQQTAGGGYNSTWPENSLDALYRAATEFEWRPAESTLRMVIHTTDDTFWPQATTTVDGVPTVHNYAETVTALQSAKVRVFSFASKLGGPTEQDDVGAGWFGTFAGSPSIPDATGGGVYELDGVLGGTISLSNAIPAAVKESQCKPYPTPK